MPPVAIPEESPKQKLRIAIIGQSMFAAEVFKLLIKEGHEVVGVFTVLDKGNREDPLEIVRTVSSTSLAGSYLHLPRFKPYSVHDASIKETDEEIMNAEHLDVDYTKETSKEIVFDEVLLINNN